VLCPQRHYVSNPHPPRFPADGGEGTDSTAVHLVPAPCSHDLKVERLIKLAQLLRLEPQTERHLAIGRHDPTEYRQPAGQALYNS